MTARGSRWGRILLGTLALLSVKAALASQEESDHIEAPGDQWLVLGTFEGSAAGGWLARINNWLFEYESDDSLFEDLGDLGLGLGIDIGTVQVDWDSFFRRRVIRSHEDLPSGSTVTDGHLSHYRSLSRARTRLRLSYDYLPDLVGEVGVGAELEGGYSLALARSHLPRVSSDYAFEPIVRKKAGEELREFFVEQDLSLESDLIDLTFGALAGVLDKGVGEFGERFADTEQAALFYDGYGDPLTFITTSHLPPTPLLFTAADSPLAIGDALTFTTFVGFSPTRAGFKELGVRASFKRFFRFIRETTIRKEPDGTALVRVRKIYWDGNELIPFKIRPELRFLLVVKLAYTFFEAQRNSFHETVSDDTYRIDLKNEAGRRFFEHLVETATEVQRKPPQQGPVEIEGVERLGSEYRRGKTRDRRVKARLFSWIRLRESHISSIQRVKTENAELNEVIRARIKHLKKPFGRKRRLDTSAVITVQSDLRGKGSRSEEELGAGESFAATIETSLALRGATEFDQQTIRSNLRSLLELEELEGDSATLPEMLSDTTRDLTFHLRLSFGPEQVRRLEGVTENQLWIVLAELMLGPQHRGVWSNASRRFWWMPTERAHGRASYSDRHISERYDSLRGFQRSTERSLGFAGDRHGSRELFSMASKMVKKFKGLQEQFREGDCLSCVAAVLSRSSDVFLLQALMVRFAGGVEEGGVGYRAELFTQDMPAPQIVSNDLLYTYRHKRGAEILENVEQTREPPPRLRAGEVFLNVARGGQPLATSRPEPCWKLRLHSNLLFEGDMPLRVYLREARAGTDEVKRISTLDLGEAHDVEKAPLMVAQYFYEVPLPWSSDVKSDETYTLLLRVLNSQGLPVTEEQEIRLSFPDDWQQKVPARCAE